MNLFLILAVLLIGFRPAVSSANLTNVSDYEPECLLQTLEDDLKEPLPDWVKKLGPNVNAGIHTRVNNFLQSMVERQKLLLDGLPRSTPSREITKIGKPYIFGYATVPVFIKDDAELARIFENENALLTCTFEYQTPALQKWICLKANVVYDLSIRERSFEVSRVIGDKGIEEHAKQIGDKKITCRVLLNDPRPPRYRTSLDEEVDLVSELAPKNAGTHGTVIGSARDDVNLVQLRPAIKFSPLELKIVKPAASNPHSSELETMLKSGLARFNETPNCASVFPAPDLPKLLELTQGEINKALSHKTYVKFDPKKLVPKSGVLPVKCGWDEFRRTWFQTTVYYLEKDNYLADQGRSDLKKDCVKFRLNPVSSTWSSDYRDGEVNLGDNVSASLKDQITHGDFLEKTKSFDRFPTSFKNILTHHCLSYLSYRRSRELASGDVNGAWGPYSTAMVTRSESEHAETFVADEYFIEMTPGVILMAMVKAGAKNKYVPTLLSEIKGWGIIFTE